MTEKLADVLGGMDTGLGKAIEICGRLSLWEQVVDERVRKNAAAVKIINRTLYVSTATPTWANELSYLKKEIIKKFNEKAGQEVIRDIRFSCRSI